MSYSFNVRAATKEAALQKVGEELDKIIVGQPMHSNDRDAAVATAKAFLAILPDDPEGREFSVSVNGSIGWSQGGPHVASVISGVGVGVSIQLISAA